ncbi:alkaline phosphatase, tissue-nonspecific isozyme-like [Uloborus diversus]|uniref:alkaline phosphatase, tissue-nonspecific isozyme-like n=1 Tax=Uloborus diversus TaxID=327109 RepID=UPI002409DBDC|nr:alkaline phosphatase, tissue-nonspecific isozyme-like [Uloborus diversus]
MTHLNETLKSIAWCRPIEILGGQAQKAGDDFCITYRKYWYDQAKAQLLRNLRDSKESGSAVARNVILFIGDGMGLTTVTTARILRGQLQGKTGEENQLAFDRFQHVALAKTYNTDSQVGESGACATALLCGVKGRFETVGLDDGGIYNRCETSLGSRVPSLAEWAQAEGKSTGLVTTTRVTHATPAAMYAHTPNRYWESDDKLPKDIPKDDYCKDIARQLVEDSPGKNLNVILGGGRRHFLPRLEEEDSKGESGGGRREDGRNLISEWQRDKKGRGLSYKYVSRKRELDKVDPAKVDYLLGLFSGGHMAYESDREKGPEGEPSIARMTRKAIQVLRKNPRGYFLMVEGGRIDHSHHFNNAHRALTDTLALEEAVVAALEITRPEETLLVVTADHSHVFAFGGQHPVRGNPVLGVDDKPSDVDNMPYTTLLYANGPGYNHNFKTGRENLTSTDTTDKNYIQQAAVPRRWDSHGGEDVPVYAQGPMAHLFRGVFEQTYVPHALAFAACIGPTRGDCDRRKQLSTYYRQLVECPSPHTESEDSAGFHLQNTRIPFWWLYCAWMLFIFSFWRT